MIRRAAIAGLLVLLATIGPAHAHGFLLIDVEVTTGEDGAIVIGVVTDRSELALALVRTGRLDEALRSGADGTDRTDRTDAALTARLGALAAAQLALTGRDGRALTPRALLAGGDDRIFRLRLTVEARDGVTARLALHPGHQPPPTYRIFRLGQSGPDLRHEGDVVELVTPAPPEPLGRLLVRYARQGFLHVLPWGLDHVLFVLGLALLARGWRQLLAAVTAFTVAHSLTLGAAMIGLLPTAAYAQAIEVLIALSLVAVAVEAARPPPADPRRGRHLRLVVVFVFGLVHGLGFAGALADLGISGGRLVPILVAFNLGVEAGQLATIALGLLAVGWTRSRPWHRARVVLPASALIAGCGLSWAIQRAIG